MEPQLPSPNLGPEKAPLQTGERLRAPISGPEVSSPAAPERQETREMQPGGPADPASQAPVVNTPPPLPQIQQPVAQPAQQPVNDNPASAADEDLIEKEWVDKAKKVIAETKHDPYLQEQAVSRLQADYLQKRYNKSVKVPGEGA